MIEDNQDAVQKRTLKEVAQGHGGMCGSAFIDQNMRNLIKSRLQSFADDMPTCMFEMIMDTFIERIKVRVYSLYIYIYIPILSFHS
jgi:hypothetical protein